MRLVDYIQACSLQDGSARLHHDVIAVQVASIAGLLSVASPSHLLKYFTSDRVALNECATVNEMELGKLHMAFAVLAWARL